MKVRGRVVVNDSIDLCESMIALKVDVNAPNRSIYGVNAALMQSIVVLDRICLGCVKPMCESCTFLDLAKLFYNLCGVGVVGPCEM